jgi:hypothetical protein
MATKLWKFLTTDIRELITGQTVEIAKTGADSAKAVFDLAKALQEQGVKVQDLKPYVLQISSLLDVLNSPLAQVVGSAIPFAPIAITLLKIYRDVTKKEPTFEQCVALVSQVAYLESFKEFYESQQDPELSSKLAIDTPASKQAEAEIRDLGTLEFDSRQARIAIIAFHDSSLSEAFGRVLTMRLLEYGLDKDKANNIVERVSRSTDRYIELALAEVGDRAKRLFNWYSTGGYESLEKYFSLETYLEEIAAKPLETVFAEKFTFKDIYVPLKAQPLNANGEIDKVKPSEILETWAEKLLQDENKQDRVMFVQGGPGRGKSVFCRMFAEWVRVNLHPIWTPILIRLRDIRTIEKNFEETLRLSVDRDFVKNDSGWLTDRNTRYLFLLDGFDELLMEGRTSGGLEEFLSQVGKFQESCKNNPEKGHRVLITGRTLSLERIDRHLPSNLERVEILPMDADVKHQWFEKWDLLVGTNESQAFQGFLQDSRCPERIRGSISEIGLAQEPLLLYLLAAMHRDGELKIEDFEGTGGVGAKILIYEKSLDWVLTKQRPDWLNRDLTELEIDGLRRILSEAGLCVVQAGGECASLTMIESRLNSNNNAKALLEQARQRLGDNPLKNALAAFYLQPTKGKEKGGSVEFAHKSFGEFLCANRIKESLEDCAKPGDNSRREFCVSNDEMDWEIYDLLGYGALTQEIVEYLIGLLAKSDEVNTNGNFKRLFQRLEKFYLRWCNGEFIDAPPNENQPQKKTQQLKEQLKDRGTPLGLRQVDIYTGLNVMILLLELNRYAKDKDDLKDKIAFYPCGKRESSFFAPQRLLKIISYTHCISINTFGEIVGKFLSGAYFNEAYLTATPLGNANFSGANLSGANLSGIYLSGYDTNLSGANLSGANLENIRWGKETSGEKTNWKDVRGLETAENVPEELKRQLGI